MIKYCFSLIVFVCATNVWAWNDETTHPTISEYAAKQYFDQPFLKKTFTLEGETRFASKWIERGAKLEDVGTKWQFVNGTARSLNHFHVPTITNPTKNTLETSGLSDRATGISALVWAQNGPYQVSKGWEDWSWQKVREHYYNQLTALTQTDADTNMARMLMGLGYQMHLVQDMGHPSHVRNNTHILDGAGWKGFETWAAKNDSNIIRAGILDKKDAAGNYLYPVPQASVDLTAKFDDTHNLAPVARLFDTRTYLGTNTPTTSLGQGLSEYTNGNFFSQDTVFAAERFATDASFKYYFPYPRKNGTDAQQFIDGNKADYISKTGEGETITHLARSGVMSRFLLNTLGEGKRFYGSFMLDDECYLDYAKKLIPASVAYSKAMLDYFYRGKIDVQPVPDGVTFRTITVTAQNTTANGEEMPAGEVSLVIRYKELLESGSGPMRTLNFPADEYKYRVVTLPGQIKIPTANDPEPTVQLTFDLSADPLPLHIADVTLQLVYKGKLGNEEGAVAVGSKTLDALGTDIAISLPSSGIYAKTSGSNFTGIALTAVTNIPGGLSLADGVIELVLEYQVATSDPFASLPVDSEPQNADSYIIRLAEKNGVNTLPQGVPVELQFDLSVAPLPLWATDVYLNVVYRRSGDPETKSLAVGYHDISEPTPVDVYNNTDKVCIRDAWYEAGSPAALTAVDDNTNGIADESDIYPHDLTDIYAKMSALGNPAPASATVYDLNDPGPLVPAGSKRLGYILTDYSFTYSLLEKWVHTSPDDLWTRTEAPTTRTGTAVRNQTDVDGNYSYPGMYMMRGNPMWWGIGLVYDNMKYPTNSTCDWGSIP